jgi:cytochrome c551/c552
MRLLQRGSLPVIVAVATAVVGSAAAQAPPAGDAARGRAVFTSKQCVRCHLPRAEQGVGPALEELRVAQGAYHLAGRLWNHAPAMFTVLKVEGLAWPQISVAEMADLMAYLEADAGRDPTPDLRKGQMLLLSKGCLKCHSFKREGARAAPDLAERRADLAPAPTWAAKLWSHTPRMAEMAIQRGVLYPRFSRDEMNDLLGFLRSGRGTP